MTCLVRHSPRFAHLSDPKGEAKQMTGQVRHALWQGASGAKVRGSSPLVPDAHLGGETARGRNGRPPLIAHVIHRLDVGGLENGLVNLINRMPSDRYRHTIVCLKDHTGFSARIERPVELFEMHKREGKDPALYLRLWHLFRRLQPDIVHTRNLAALEAQLPALLTGVRHRVHGEHGRDIHDLDNTSRKYRWLRAAFRPLVQRYIPLSKELEAYLARDVGVPAGKIRRICNGVDRRRFQPAGERRAPLPIEGFAPADSVVVGTVGRMEAVKDQLTLARAFVRLAEQLPKRRERLRLVLIGDGALRSKCQRILADAGLAEQVWLPGSRDDVPELLRAFDIFVLPSLAEGISNTLLEAMASGLPVVATDVGGNGELVANGETGFIIPRADPFAMADAIQRYVENPGVRKTHATNARARAESEFSIDNMVNKYLAVYDELLTADR